MEDLIPGLPDDVARECLARIPYAVFPSARAACRLWRAELDSASFLELRRAGGLSRALVAMAQAGPVSGPDPSKHRGSTFWPVLFDPATDEWARIPCPDRLFPAGLPLFCQLAAAGPRLVVVGGWDPSSFAASPSVFIYDFLIGSWKRGRSMPGPARSFFACASDGARTVYVAGGHDEEKNALRSALAYDVEADDWSWLPDMAAERDEPRGMFRCGRFRVAGGYATNAQGRFGTSGEEFHVESGSWCHVEDMVIGDADVDVPQGVRVAPVVAQLPGGGLVVVGSTCHGGAHECHVADQEGRRWRKAATPPAFSGHVQSCCTLQI